MKRKRVPETEEMVPRGTQRSDLDQLIEERTHEKQKALNEELQRKLRIIRDRSTSGGNNEPFPEGTFERLQRNDIFGNVLEYFTDPTDISDAYFACRTFAEILEKRRILMKLPKVLNIFKAKVDEAYEFKGRQVGNAYYQNWSTICLRGRGVCKAWKEIYDFHSDTASDEWLVTTDWTIRDDHRTNLFHFKYEDSFDKAASSVINQSLTVSPIRDVFLVVNDPVSEPLYRKLKEYFKAYGASVRFLCFHHASRGNVADAMYEKLSEILKCTENLKRLYVYLHNNSDDDDTDTDTDTDEDEMAELGEAFQDHRQGINEYPLPALESLVHFSCNDWGRKESFVTQILEKCVNLTAVRLYYTEPTEQETTDALMALTLERFEGLHTIITSNQATWPLKYLKLFPGGESDMYASVLFPAINRFWQTLEELHIWGRMIMDAGVTTARLELPHLKTISIICIHRGTLGFDDLLPLKSLVKIMVDTPKSVKYEDENALVKVKTYLESGEIHKSNVWQCFPNLMRFKIRFGCTYCRPPTSCSAEPTSYLSLNWNS